MSGRGPIDGERGASGVAPRSRLFSRKQKVTGFLIVGAGAMLALLYLGRGDAPKSSKEHVAPLKFAAVQTLSVPPEPRPAPAPAPAPVVPAPAAQMRPITPAPQPAPTPEPQGAASAPKLLVIDDNGSGDRDGSPVRMRATDGGQDDESELAKSLRPTVLKAVSATIMPHPEMTIAQGASLPCVMDTAIGSQTQGLARCHLPVAIRGEVGARGEHGIVLLPRDTVITGEVRAGNAVKAGQTRIAVLWTLARTPNGVKIALESPATDRVGMSGIPGSVDNHWGERFGNALLFTLIDDTTQIISARLSKGGQTSINLNTASSSASDQFRDDARIPPTITVHHGDVIGITVARDLDFNSVYQLQLRQPGQ